MSPFLDDRGRLFGKVNLVDLLVIVALVALAAFAFVRYSGGGAGAEPATLRTLLVVERVRDTSAAQFEEGAQVQDDTGTVLGTIERVTERRNLVEVPNDRGELTVRDSPIFWDVEVVVTGPGFVSPGSYRVGSLPLLAGKQLIIRSRGVEARATIRSVGEVS